MATMLAVAVLLSIYSLVYGHVMRDTVLQSAELDTLDRVGQSVRTAGYQEVEVNCTLTLGKRSISKFRHEVYYTASNFVYLKLEPGPGVSITGSNIIVGEMVWVWTFYGKEGGLELLNWPVEFGIWSMGLLTSYVLTKPLPMKVNRATGNCSHLQVGREEDNKVISKALLNLTIEMMELNPKYGPSFFCYLTRKYIEPHFVYVLCKHIVCPIEALKYDCCSYYYSVSEQKRMLGCKEHIFEYDPFNWILPTVASLVLFGFCPIFILYIGHFLADGDTKMRKCTMQNVVENSQDINASHENIILLDGHHHVTFFNTVLSPVRNCWNRFHKEAGDLCKLVLDRICRLVFPFLSLTVIAVEVLLDYFFLHTFVIQSVNKGVPMGFRSVLAGYRESKTNFLPYLEGPFVAVGIYLFIATVLLLSPTSLSGILLSGLQGNQVDESYSPLLLRLRSIELFGSSCFRKRRGFNKLHSVLLAQFFMMINWRFWKHVISVQYVRWENISCSKCCILLLPFYILLCIFEILLCFAYYGFPITSFGILIIKAYCGRLSYHNSRRTFLVRLVFRLFTVILVVSVVYFFYMFCTIFMDACLFITRVAVFTFTGIVVYPKVSYGYLIFTLTVIYYIWQCIKEFSLVYQRLLQDTVKVCETLQRANDTNRLIRKIDGCKGVNGALFSFVIEKHYPRRKQVFLSVLKVGIIILILGLSINILVETDGFRELHVVMHVGTALFICSLPQIIKSVCHDESKTKQKRFRKELKETISKFINCDDSHTSDSDLLEEDEHPTYDY